MYMYTVCIKTYFKCFAKTTFNTKALMYMLTETRSIDPRRVVADFIKSLKTNKA